MILNDRTEETTIQDSNITHLSKSGLGSFKVTFLNVYNYIRTKILAVANTWTGQQTINNQGTTAQSFTPSGTTQTIDFNSGSFITLTLSSASGNVTLTLNNPMTGAKYKMIVVQGSTARDLIFPSTPSRYDTLSTATFVMDASSTYAFDIEYNGSSYIVNYGKLT